MNEVRGSRIGAIGKATIGSITGLALSWFMAGLVVITLIGFAALERRERRRGHGESQNRDAAPKHSALA